LEEINNENDTFQAKIIIKIKDEGRGMSVNGINNLFVDFKSLKDQNPTGTGLGLSICK